MTPVNLKLQFRVNRERFIQVQTLEYLRMEHVVSFITFNLQRSMDHSESDTWSRSHSRQVLASKLKAGVVSPHSNCVHKLTPLRSLHTVVTTSPLTPRLHSINSSTQLQLRVVYRSASYYHLYLCTLVSSVSHTFSLLSTYVLTLAVNIIV